MAPSETPGRPAVDAILVADGVHRHFAGITAVDVGHFEVPRGKITALIGPNGAGKTTFFNLLTGFDQPQRGTWSFDGRPLRGLAPYKVARLGMVRTFQLTKVLGRLTVLDNMLLGSGRQTGERLRNALLPFLWKRQHKSDIERARELLTRFKLGPDAYAASLSGGQRKLLEMARALMSEPTLVMLDEPMAGVNPALTQSLLGHIRDLKEEGMTVLFVEHDMHMVRSIADHVVVMAAGRIIAEGAPESVLSEQAVIDAYLGDHHDTDLRALIEEDA
ncbi:ABC transporter ATP-binding protein [Actinoplanes sp. CA-054009]